MSNPPGTVVASQQATATWQPTLGAWPSGNGACFRVWAPQTGQVEVLIEKADGQHFTHTLGRSSDGTFAAWVPLVQPGDRYRYRLNGDNAYPDPASRFQPEGVHGPSEVIDPGTFSWTDQDWKGLSLEDAVIYELHVGTFSPEGTFAGALARLPYLRELGVTAVEIMPVADFPGERNWGYDGVNLFAPARCYGRPDDLRRLIDQAHRLGLAVILDVVYNHLGPDGNYLGVYSPFYFSKHHHTGWGAALNFDGEHSDKVRGFFLENALHWFHEYHIDGLRLDATHAICDDSSRHFLAELSQRVHRSVPDRHILLIAEDHRNLAHMVRPGNEGGWGLDAVWADCFHHQLRRLLAGDTEGYYRDYTGSVTDLATTIRKGWFYCGQTSTHLGEPRGTDPAGLAPQHFVICVQNHDQIGNRALGERLHHQIDLAAYRAASTLLLCSPATPLLFMGQEWAASTPFLYFTDHHEELGRLVTEGRRKEFRAFSAFSHPEAREKIPDPQAGSTFTASRLVWDELRNPPHAGVLHLYQALLRLRRTEPACRTSTRESFEVAALADDTILLRRTAREGPALLAIVRLRGAGRVELDNHPLLRTRGDQPWQVVLTTEDPAFTVDPAPLHVDLTRQTPSITFPRPAAVLLREGHG